MISGTTAAAPADDPIARGLALRRVGDDQSALPLFQKAYETTHAPRAAAQLGLCEQALGSWTDAETHLTEALKAGDDAWVRKNRSTLDASVVVIKSHIGRLEIVGEPAGAEVTVNGIVVGTLPLAEPVRLGAAEVEIDLRAPGYAHISRSVRVEGGGTQKIELRAERETRAPTVVATPLAAAPASPAPVGMVQGEPPAASAREKRPAWRAPARWVSLGLGGASLGIGLYGILHNRSLVNEFDAGCWIDSTTNMARAIQGSTQTDAGCANLKSSYQSASTVGTIGLVGAGVFVAAGVVLWLTDPPSKELQTALRSCGAGPAPGAAFALGCALRF